MENSVREDAKNGGIWQAGRAVTRQDVIWLAALFGAALAIRLYFLRFFTVISADGIGYVSVAREIVRWDTLIWSTNHPPVYPLLIGLVSLLVPDFELAGRIVSMVMGSLIVVPVYLLAVELFDRRVGVMACLLAMVWSSLRMWSGEVMSQATYITLMLLGSWLLWHAFRKRSGCRAAAGGLVMALAYLTRPEALITFAAVTLVLLLVSLAGGISRQRLAGLILAGCGGFALLFTPYLFLLHQATGHWQLTGKTGMALADALSDYLGRPDMKREAGFQSLGFLDVIRMYPDFVKANFLKNLRETWHAMLPPAFWGLAVLGFMAGGWRMEKVWERLFLLATFAPLTVIVIFFFIGPEYLQPYLPALFLWTGQGLLQLEWLVIGRLSTGGPSPWKNLLARVPVALGAVAIIAGVLLVRQIPSDRNKPYHFSDDGARYDHKRIGLLLKEHLPPGVRIMSRSGRIGYYAERERVDMPQASLAEIIVTARTSGARYIVVDGTLPDLRPQLGVLFQPLFSGEERVLYVEKGPGYRPLPGLRLYLLYKDPSSLGVAVYEVAQ